MPHHYNVVSTTEKHSDLGAVKITYPDHAVDIFNSTLTVSFSELRPSTVRELYHELEGPPELYDALQLLFTELTGDEIDDPKWRP